MSTIKVLVVDDSGFFRRRIAEALEADGDITVIATADNGRQALVEALKREPDVITMDVEMPVMDGITAVRRLMSLRPTPVLMLSSLTREGAQATLDALEAGALDFVPKRFEDMARGHEQGKRALRERVRALHSGQKISIDRAVASPAPRASPAPPARRDLVVIASSTGGPTALTSVLEALPANFPYPLLLVQHMPASFTEAFAARLDRRCAITVREAGDGDRLQPGLALLAPGGRQMIVEAGARPRVRVIDGSAEQHYRPSADVTLASVAELYPATTTAVILTGMGADGREGARELHRRGSRIWAQDRHTSVVYGMPAAVINAGLAHRVLPLTEIAGALRETGRRACNAATPSEEVR